MANPEQKVEGAKNFSLGPLTTLSQVIVALGKTIRAMADDSLDAQKGARICNGLGIMRACFQTQLEAEAVQQLTERIERIEEAAPQSRWPEHRTTMQ